MAGYGYCKVDLVAVLSLAN